MKNRKEPKSPSPSITSLDRRRFLARAAAAGLALSVPLSWRLPFSLERSVMAADTYAGPLWIVVGAGGGWDQSLICDPGYLNGATLTARTRNSLSLAAIAQPADSPIRYFNGWPQQKAFFDTFYKRSVVFNGVAYGTNNHDVGVRVGGSGRVPEGSPCLLAQIGAALAPNRAMCYLDFGGYSDSAGLVSAAHAEDRSLLRKIINPNSGSNSTLLIQESVRSQVNAAMSARLARLKAKQHLPTPQNAIDKVAVANAGQSTIASIQLSNDIPYDALYNGTAVSGEFNRIRNAVDTGLAAFRAGLTIGMTIGTEGFDTHSDNDNNTRSASENLFMILNYIMAAAGTTPVVLVVVSDFGRSPQYVSGGTDHWPTGSFLVTSNFVSGSQPFTPNRVIGSADRNLNPIPVLKSDPTRPDPTNGEAITAADFHSFLRRMAGIDGHPLLAPFALNSKVVVPV